MSKTTRTKRQHIIPRFYLKNFSEKEKAWVIDFHLNKKPYKTTLDNILCMSDFYTITTKDNPQDDIVEQKFSQVEGDAKPVLDKIINNMELPQKQDKEKLAVFLASLYVRTPLLRQMQLEMYESLIKCFMERHISSKDIYQEYVSKVENPIDEATAKRLWDERDIEGCISREGYIRMMLELWPTITAVFSHMTWSTHLADPLKPERFITGDFPFIIENKENRKFEFPQYLFANKYIKLYLPLSSLTCLTMEYDSKQAFNAVISPTFIPIINSQIAVHSQRYVVSKTKNISWYKAGHVYNSADLLHKEFHPNKLNQPISEITNMQGRFEKAKPRPLWNKLKGDKPNRKSETR